MQYILKKPTDDIFYYLKKKAENSNVKYIRFGIYNLVDCKGSTNITQC